MTRPRSPFRVQLASEQASLPVSVRWVTAVVRAVLAAEEVAAAEISVLLVDNPAMRALNVKHLQHDYDTDVLSFLLDETPAPARSRAKPSSAAPRGRGKEIEGELIVSVEMACEQAEKYGWTPRGELTLYLVHGLLHLCGYDDLVPREKKLMRRREGELLALWNLTPHYDE